MLQLLIVHILLQAGLCISNDSFQVGLQNRFTLIGSNATFNCQISHNQTVDIEWSFSPVHSNKTVVILTTEQTEGQFIGASDVTNVQGSGVSDSKNNVKYYREVWPDLTIVRVTAEDAGTYTARLIQHDMSISAELSLIDSKPECSISDPGPVYYEGEHVTLNCNLGYHANHLPDLEWTVPKLHVDYDHLITTHKNSENMVSTSIDLQLQHMIDGKLFQCSAKFQNITRVTSCTSMFPPESVLYHAYVVDMLTNPRTDIHNRMVDEGSNITLFCNAHGNPKPTWTWFYITDKGEKTRLDCEHRVCVLYVLRHTDTGTYQCHIDNTINGTVYTDHQEIFLKVTPSASKPVHYQSNTVRPVAVETHTQTISPYAIGAVVCAGLAVFLIVAFVIMALKMRRREQQQHKRLTRMRDENFDDQEVELLDENIQPDTSELPLEYGRLKQQWEIPRKDVRCTEHIAKGTFVEVWQGKMRKYPRRNDIMKVAVKKIIAEATEKERRFFLAELEVMKAIQPHPNILSLIGCYTQSDPWLMMVEYAVHGSLYQYLQLRRPGDLCVQITADVNEAVTMRNNNLTAHKLLCLTAQVVNALQHINRYKMMYYRLRSASVLVCKGDVLKLSGFGFPQDITERNIYESNSAPVRWMSPESLLDNVFNMKTDIWSLGVLIWEIVHFGHLPYPDMGPQEVLEKIQTGYRMSQPPHCSPELYNLMLMCWAEEPNNRPSFEFILQKLANLDNNADVHILLDKLPDCLRSSSVISEEMETRA